MRPANPSRFSVPAASIQRSADAHRAIRGEPSSARTWTRCPHRGSRCRCCRGATDHLPGRIQGMPHSSALSGIARATVLANTPPTIPHTASGTGYLKRWPHKNKVDCGTLAVFSITASSSAHALMIGLGCRRDHSGLSTIKHPPVAIQEISLSAPPGAFEGARAAVS
jgi:hypothetical protein